jgi:hypothetical protein
VRLDRCNGMAAEFITNTMDRCTRLFECIARARPGGAELDSAVDCEGFSAAIVTRPEIEWLLRSRFDSWHATCNMQPATRNRQHATDNTHQTTRNRHYAIDDEKIDTPHTPGCFERRRGFASSLTCAICRLCASCSCARGSLFRQLMRRCVGSARSGGPP